MQFRNLEINLKSKYPELLKAGLVCDIAVIDMPFNTLTYINSLIDTDLSTLAKYCGRLCLLECRFVDL